MKKKSPIPTFTNNMSYNPKVGLPQDIFYFVSAHTPLVCIDLLIKTNDGILLTWRSDKFYGPGWHIPGGIIRFKEKIEVRIKKTLRNELSVKLNSYSESPIDFNEQFNPKRNIRGHFIALLYKCSIDKNPPEKIRYKSNTKINGTWKWHNSFPKNMIKQHQIYKKYFKDF